jgi:hypothetical protein
MNYCCTDSCPPGSPSLLGMDLCCYKDNCPLGKITPITSTLLPITKHLLDFIQHLSPNTVTIRSSTDGSLIPRQALQFVEGCIIARAIP